MDLRRIEFEGVELGNAGEPIQPVLTAFRQRGVVISAGTASSLKRVWNNGEQHNGNEVRDRLLCATKLGSNDATLKDQYYLPIAEAGVRLRVRQEQISARWSSRPFTELIAADLNLHPNIIRLSIRAMRTDLTYTAVDELLDKNLGKYFIQTAADLLKIIPALFHRQQDPQLPNSRIRGISIQ